MRKFRMYNKITGIDLGTYKGNTEEEALGAYAADMGYGTYQKMQETLADPYGYPEDAKDDGFRCEEKV